MIKVMDLMKDSFHCTTIMKIVTLDNLLDEETDAHLCMPVIFAIFTRESWKDMDALVMP